MAKSFNARMKEKFQRITTNAQKVNELIHETACEIIEHAKEHGDCSTAQGLVMAMPASMRREMLILWFATFTPIVVKNDDKWGAKMHKEGTKLYVPWDIEGAKAKPFYELANENKEKPALTFEAILKMVEGLGKRIEKQLEEGKVAEEDILSAQAAAVAITGLKLARVKPAEPDTPANDKADEQAPEQKVA